MSELAEGSLSEIYRQHLEDFIEAYRNEPCLWQRKAKEYHDRNKKDAAYARLLNIYKSIEPNATRDTLVKKINNMRTSYRKQLNKMKRSEQSGASCDDIPTPRLWYFQLFSFLNEEEKTYKDEIQESPDESSESSQLNTNSINVESPQSQSADEWTPSSRQRTVKRSTAVTDEPFNNVYERFKCPRIEEDRFDYFGKTVAIKLRELPTDQRIIAEKLINDTLFYAEMGSLTVSHFVKGPETKYYIPDEYQ